MLESHGLIEPNRRCQHVVCLEIELLAGLAVPQRAKAKSLLTSDTRSDNILPIFRLLLGGFLGMAHRATRLHAFSGSSLTSLIQGSLSQASDGQEVIQSPVLLCKK